MSPVRLRLPATSANLGPGFDALALALALYLEVEAVPAAQFSIRAEGRCPEVCGALEGNLLLDTYRDVWTRHAKGPAQSLALAVHNGIPLGMGCGSSAASRVAGIALAAHFAELGWAPRRILDEAARLEHHPDNAAACVLGGLVASGYALDDPARVEAVSIAPPAGWHALLALPEMPLATTVSRGILPLHYDRATAVTNLQNVALLVAAFAAGDTALLRSATADHLHQPFRAEACPLLPCLLPLAGQGGILSVTLSGAGSGVLLLLENVAVVSDAAHWVRHAAAVRGISLAELVDCSLDVRGADFAVFADQATVSHRG